MDKNPHTTRVFCTRANCENSFSNHKWGSVKAHGDGWLIQKDGTIWCPEHTPTWVVNWRDKGK